MTEENTKSKAEELLRDELPDLAAEMERNTMKGKEELLREAVPDPVVVVVPEPAAESVPGPEEVHKDIPKPEAAPEWNAEKKVYSRKEAKKRAKEDVREMARETVANKRQWEMERRQQKLAEREQFPTGHLRRKARRIRWKQEKMARREELKRRYKDAPWFIRIPRLYLLKPFVALLIIGIVLGGAGAAVQLAAPQLLFSWFETNKNNPVSEEEIYALSPIDEKGQKRIDAVAPVDKDDTWTISLYIVGADLEDWGENDLSEAVKDQVMEVALEQQAKRAASTQKLMKDFTGELEGQDLELPSYLFYPDKPVRSGSSGESSSGETIAEMPGAASTDIGEVTKDTWSDNIRVVIQTGGATRWSNTLINPNRTQRFVYYKGALEEVENLPLQRATDPKTLTSFMKYCREEYPADHNMLVLWNHGGGAFGYGSDSIYGGGMTLADIRESLEGAFKPNEKDPAYDIIGFDACLMSSLEVTHALDGFASYYAVSEETEPGNGWDYTPWLKAMTKDPTMSPAKVCQEIADSYMDFYMTQNVNAGWLITNDVTFCVLDAKKTEELYDAWCDLTKQQLIDAAKDPGVLAEIGRCSNKSTHFVSSVYNLYNTVDLGNYVDMMADTYPKECSRIKKLIGETVMYHRENGSLSDSQGISIYMPGSVETYAGLQWCLNYIYNISEDPATKALYYYKVAGCLNDDMQEYLATLTDVKPKTLNLKPFNEFTKQHPSLTETGFDLPIDPTLQDMLQTYELEIGLYDEETGTITNYGRDELVELDGKGNMHCDFDGKWICYDGIPLATEVVSANISNVEYRSKVLYNGSESYLCFTYDRDTEEFTINGIRSASDLSGGLFNNDQFNYMINSRMNKQIKKGDEIVPLYEVQEMGENEDGEIKEGDPSKGDPIKVGKGSLIEMKDLPSGYYLAMAVISDHRGDVYYSRVIGNQVAKGTVKKREENKKFVGRSY